MTSPTLSRYVYGGRYRRPARVAGLAALTVVIATTRPHPDLHGDGLVILVTLVLTLAAQLGTVAAPDRAATPRAVVGAVACGVLAGFDPGTSWVLLAFTGLDVAASLPLAPATWVTALAVVTDVLATLVASRTASDGLLAVAVIAGYLFGTSLRQHELRAEEAELRLADIETANLERARAVQLAERASAAREIHDILAHNLGALVMQLDAVDAVLEGDHPDLDRVRPILRQAHQHAVNGLVEARQAVSSLREDTEPVEVSLRKLVDAAPPASLEVDGPTRPVPADSAIVVRRTAQEALTNAAKHAPGAVPCVRLSFEASSVVLAVTDTGRPPGARPSPLAGTGGGHGLEGMRERAELIGADLTAGPDGPGWQVRLTIPLPDPGAS